MMPLNTTHHMANAMLLAAIVFVIAAIGPASSFDAVSRDEMAVRRLMASAKKHQEGQNQPLGILAPVNYEFVNPSSSSSVSSSSGPSKKSAKNGGVSQWHSLNGMWGKRDGRFGGLQFDENDLDYAGEATEGDGEVVAAPVDCDESSSSSSLDFKVNKRSWKSLNGAWGKRSVRASDESEADPTMDQMPLMMQKKAWRSLNGAWGKRVCK